MKYACLVYQCSENLDIPLQELGERMRGCGAWVDRLAQEGRSVFCGALQQASTAATLRMCDGKVHITDGPFAETKEFLAGVTVLEARDMNDALREAAKLAACSGATIEVRAVLEPGAPVSTATDRRILAALAGEAESISN